MHDEIYRICKPIFEKTLQEQLPNSMTIIPPAYKCVWRPNNWRREIEVKTKDNSAIQRIKSTIDPTNQKQINICEHTKLISWKNYHPQITIQYGRTSLIGIYNQERNGSEKVWFEILGNSLEELETKIEKKRQEINERIDAALLDFAKAYEIKYPFNKPRQIRGEDGIKGDEFLDSLPDSMIIHDTIFKKVYRDNVEFKSGKGEPPSIVRAKTYIKNRALEEFSPVICQEINTTHEEIKNLALITTNLANATEHSAQQTGFFKDNIISHIPVYVKIAENTDKNTVSVEKTSASVQQLATEIGKLCKVLGKILPHSEQRTISKSQSFLTQWGDI